MDEVCAKVDWYLLTGQKWKKQNISNNDYKFFNVTISLASSKTIDVDSILDFF